MSVQMIGQPKGRSLLVMIMCERSFIRSHPVRPLSLIPNLLFHFDVDVNVFIRNVGAHAVSLPVTDQIRYHPRTLIVRPVSVVVAEGVDSATLRVASAL